MSYNTAVLLEGPNLKTENMYNYRILWYTTC